MSLYATIKNTIRRCRTPDAPATGSEVKQLLATHDKYDGEALMEAYQQAKRQGEIYEYPADSGTVVKITDEV